LLVVGFAEHFGNEHSVAEKPPPLPSDVFEPPLPEAKLVLFVE
jgi:hypothetical protein